MNTLPSITIPSLILSGRPRCLSAELNYNQDISTQNTEKINYTDIKVPTCMNGPISKLDCNLDFNFERDRIKALANTELFIMLNTTNLDASIQSLTSKCIEKIITETTKAYTELNSITYYTRIIAVIFSIIFTLGLAFIVSTGVILWIFDNPIEGYLIPVSLDGITSLIFVCLSISLSDFNRFNIKNNQKMLKIYLIFIISMGVLIFSSYRGRTLTSLIMCANNSELDTTLVLECFVLICTYISLILKMIITCGYSIIWILSQIILNRIAKLKLEFMSPSKSFN